MAQLPAAANTPLKRGGKRGSGNGDALAMTLQIVGNVTGSVGSVLLSKGYVALLLSSCELVQRTEAGDRVLAFLGPLISAFSRLVSIALAAASSCEESIQKMNEARGPETMSRWFSSVFRSNLIFCGLNSE